MNDCICEDCGHQHYIVLPVVDRRRVCCHCESLRRYPRWPRGKYNGKRIVGFSFKFKIDVSKWHWKPYVALLSNSVRWGWFYVWLEPEFSNE